MDICEVMAGPQPHVNDGNVWTALSGLKSVHRREDGPSCPNE